MSMASNIKRKYIIDEYKKSEIHEGYHPEGIPISSRRFAIAQKEKNLTLAERYSYTSLSNNSKHIAG